jgi:DNA-binding protein H-NS
MMYRYDISNLKSVSVDDLWNLHLEVRKALARKISAEKKRLERQLEELRSNGAPSLHRRERRPYPRVLPKYQNPEKPEETWAGRGKQPRWLTAQLRGGKRLDDFRIRTSAASHRRRRPASHTSHI